MRQAGAGAIALCLLSCVGLARADTLVGHNGERLAGKLVEEKNGTIVFLSDLLGRVEVPSDKARVEVAPAPEAPSTPPTPPLPAEAPVAQAPPAADWELDVGARLAVDRGSLQTPEDRLALSTTLVRTTASGELHGDATYKYKRSDGDVDDNDWHASLGYDKFLSEKRFRTLRLLFDRELTSSDDYDQTQAVSATLGWRLWEKPGQHLRIGPALGFLDATRDGEDFSGAAAGVHARFLAPLPGEISASGEIMILDAFGDGSYATLQAKLRRPLGERMYVALAWNYDWSSFAIESGITSEWRWELGWRLGEGKH